LKIFSFSTGLEFYLCGPPVTATTPRVTSRTSGAAGRFFSKREVEPERQEQHNYVRYDDENVGISIVCEVGDMLTWKLPYQFECKPKTDIVDVICVGPPTTHPDLGMGTPILVRYDIDSSHRKSARLRKMHDIFKLNCILLFCF
jgi:hypothetical protein